MKYLKLFDIISNYNEYIKNDPLLPNVSLISETNEIFYSGLKLDPALLEIAGTAIVYDTAASSLMTVAGDEYNTTDYPQDVYTPVGVIIMPASHSEDGYARMMSCKLMGVKTLSDGTLTYGSYDASNMSEFDNNGGIGWAVSDDQNSSAAAVNGLLARHSDFPVTIASPSISVGTNGVFHYTNMDITNTIVGSLFSTTWIPDGDTGYGWNQSVSGDNLMPSPYDSNGGINQNIRVQGTCMDVVHGSVASNMVYDYIDNTTENNRFDLFEAARAYSTDGTNKGSWYVPSPLELVYLSARMVEIYSTMNKLNPNFDETFDILLGMTDASVDSNYLISWSSSLMSQSHSWGCSIPVSMDNYLVELRNFVCFVVAPVRNI